MKWLNVAYRGNIKFTSGDICGPGTGGSSAEPDSLMAPCTGTVEMSTVVIPSLVELDKG